MSTVEVLTLSIAVGVPVIGGIIVWIRSAFSSKNAEIKLLTAKNEAQELIISDLKLQNTRLEITGTLVNRFFSQLPSTNELPRELKP